MFVAYIPTKQNYLEWVSEIAKVFIHKLVLEKYIRAYRFVLRKIHFTGQSGQLLEWRK